MAISSSFLSISFLFITALIISSSSTAVVDASGGDHGQFNWIPATTTSTRCQGSLAECLGNEEYSMDSESNRRILATTQYISYGALQRNTVPCSKRGASYYNCQTGAEANPYNRGCSTITRCRS